MSLPVHARLKDLNRKPKAHELLMHTSADEDGAWISFLDPVTMLPVSEISVFLAGDEVGIHVYQTVSRVSHQHRFNPPKEILVPTCIRLPGEP